MSTKLGAIGTGSVSLATDNLGIVVAESSTVKRVSRTGGVSAVIASGINGLDSVAADQDSVYWTTESGDVVWAQGP